jgi:polysaccharide chain length determinant protein (PEP-CTERM system associated)
VDEPVRTQSAIERAREIWARRKWLAILAALPVAAATASLVAFLPSLYQSTAVVLVDRQQVPEELVRPTVTSGLETRLQTISQEIMSRSRLEQLITRFGLYPDLRRRVPLEQVVEQMRKDVRLDIRGADVRPGDRRATIAFALSYLGSDPQTVAHVTNTLASSYVEENLRARERQATGTAEFLRAQLDQVKGRLDEQERRVSDFKKRFVGELPQEFEVNLATLERLNAQLRLNSDSQTRALERRDAMARQMAEAGWVVGPAGSAAGPAPLALDPSAVRLAQLRQELAELRTRFSDKYPDVIRVRAEIAALEREAAELRVRTLEAAAAGKPEERPAATAPPDPQLLRMRQAVAEVEAELRGLQAEERRLREAIAAYQRRVQATPVREQEFKELSRDYESTRELYASLLKRHAESQIAESMEQRQKGEQFRVIEPALPAAGPAAPNRLRLLAVGLGLALATGAGLALLAEQLNAGFHTVDDLRAFTAVPVLVAIPRIVTARDRRRRRRLHRVAAASALAGVLLVAGTTWWVARGNEHLVSLLASRRL